MIEIVGSLDILNCGAGHLQFTFDKDKPKEIDKAREIIQDMFKRGYAVLVEVDGKLERVKRFDPEHDTYVLDDKKRRGRPKGVPMNTSKATAIPRTAGG